MARAREPCPELDQTLVLRRHLRGFEQDARCSERATSAIRRTVLGGPPDSGEYPWIYSVADKF